MTIEKVARIFKLGDTTPDKERRAYWLSQSSRERFAEVEELRHFEHKILPRLERVARVFKQTSR